MIFPINFITGFAVGAITTYVYKDEKAKTWLGNSSAKLKNGASSVTSVFKKKPAPETAAQQSAEVVEGTVETAAASA